MQRDARLDETASGSIRFRDPNNTWLVSDVNRGRDSSGFASHTGEHAASARTLARNEADTTASKTVGGYFHFTQSINLQGWQTATPNTNDNSRQDATDSQQYRIDLSYICKKGVLKYRKLCTLHVRSFGTFNTPLQMYDRSVRDPALLVVTCL